VTAEVSYSHFAAFLGTARGGAVYAILILATVTHKGYKALFGVVDINLLKLEKPSLALEHFTLY